MTRYCDEYLTYLAIKKLYFAFFNELNELDLSERLNLTHKMIVFYV